MRVSWTLPLTFMTSMRPMMEILWQLWNNSYLNSDILTFQDWIEHLRGLIWELEKAKRLLFEFGGRWKRKREATWQSMSNHTNSTWIGVMDDLGNLGRLRMFIKYRNKPREWLLIIWWIWVCEERASGWLVPCLSQFRGWKIPILIGDLERPLRYFKEIQWSHNL